MTLMQSNTLMRYLGFHFIIQKLFVEPPQCTLSTVIVQVQQIQNISAATATQTALKQSN